MEMNDYIPVTLDDPPLILFWERDTFLVALMPLVIGVLAKQIIASLVVGFILTRINLRIKDEGGMGALKAVAYWYFPSKFISKRFLPSHIREYIGA